MKNNDVELIQQILAGDENAFVELVTKYQKPVHALAWRKVGDFHIAEEITQDTFLKVYQRLHTLKDPNQFSGWLYVIATRRCYAWLRKKRIRTQPLEDAETTMGQRDAYSRHVVEQRAQTAVEAQREVVKRLLAKLKESERTVMTLHYLGEMTVEEISKFLGVSAGTIKSRLQRARHRLQKEETMIREALDHFQISPNLTDNIMREIARLKPTPSVSKPLVPWIAAASSVVLIVLMLGLGSKYFARFQQPYSLDAQTEMTVELVDAPIVQNLEVKPDVRRELGNSNVLGESDNNGQKPDEILLATAQAEGEDVSVPKQEWIQSTPLTGSTVNSFLATPEGDLYTYTKGEIYKLPAKTETWQHIFDIWTLPHSSIGVQLLIVKWEDTLYYTQSSELFASKDDGKSWNLLYSWDSEKYWNSIELILTEQAFYMAFENDIFRSEDIGKTWKSINDGLTGINALVNIQNTLFAGTSNGLYRYSDDGWKRLEFPMSVEGIQSVAATEDKFYVLAGFSWDVLDPRKVSRGLQRSWGIFRSSDLGNSWEDITPTNAWAVKDFIAGAKLIAAGDTLLVMEKGMVRSTNGGNTWMPPQLAGTSPQMDSKNPAVVINTNTIYVGSDDGLHRSTDSGKSWHIVNFSRGNQADSLILYQEFDKRLNTSAALYGIVDGKIVKTIDRGKSWDFVQMGKPITTPHGNEPPHITHIVKSGSVLHAKGIDDSDEKTLIYSVSESDNTLKPIESIPIFNSSELYQLLSQKRVLPFELQDKLTLAQLQVNSSGAIQFFKQFEVGNLRWLPQLIQAGLRGPFSVSGDTFYMEYNFKLFKWKHGDTEWSDTGVEETVELASDIARKDLKLAVSGNTVYVGKRDGRFVQSLDAGNNWKDIPVDFMFPTPLKNFKEILFAGSTVYVATDVGVATSDNGKHWHAITDTVGSHLIMEHLAIDGTTVYGVTEKTGIHRLESGTWEQIVSEIPDSVTSLAVDGSTLYVGTENNGMLHYNLEKE
ncbi:MAG: sigma-70 family RNA polymerase sigma factor [Candidatus Poribacteria bacterium]|nr:sigma-70 family RNA polymerase sigma factor [Candidatus Poribacteria bacterium]